MLEMLSSMRLLGQSIRTSLTCWWCLVWTCLAGPQIPDDVVASLEETLGVSLTSSIVACADATVSCDIASVAEDIAPIAKLLHKQFRDCPSGCYFMQQYCDEFFTAIDTNMKVMRDQCLARNDFGYACQVMMNDLNSTLEDERFELGVMCSIISPGANRQRTPQCRAVARSIVAAYPTLSDCPAVSRDECIGHFCSLMAQFRWRIRPRNLQDPDARNLHPYSFVLPGCEAVERYPFDNSSCHSRLDIHGFCDCLCDAVPEMQGAAAAECPTNADEYFLFGRLGVEGSAVSPYCAGTLCDTLDRRRASGGCARLQLPASRECRAMHLPYIRDAVACPWLEDSGQDGVLECLDGHRCSVLTDGWDCCEAHRGRGKCPQDAPVMCDYLCGGEGQYCCKPPGECTARECSPIFSAEPIFQATTTTTSTTLPPPGTGVEEESGFNVRLPRGWWVWLLLGVPLIIGLALFWMWHRRRHGRSIAEEGERRANIAEDYDGLGGFRRVRNSKEVTVETKPPIVFVDLPYLPDTRPLGLELVENKVIRVHPWGHKNGFKVGDVVVDVAGVAVSTFAEIWDRVQVERGRPPVRFAVQREGALPEALGEVLAPGSPGGEAPSAAAVAQAPAPEPREAAAEAWAAPGVPEAAPPEAEAPATPQSEAAADSLPEVVLPEEEEPSFERARRQAPRLPPPVFRKSRFEEAFGRPERDRLQEVIDRHHDKGEHPREVRWVRDAWGRQVVQAPK